MFFEGVSKQLQEMKKNFQRRTTASKEFRECWEASMWESCPVSSKLCWDLPRMPGARGAPAPSMCAEWDEELNNRERKKKLINKHFAGLPCVFLGGFRLCVFLRQKEWLPKTRKQTFATHPVPRQYHANLLQFVYVYVFIFPWNKDICGKFSTTWQAATKTVTMRSLITILFCINRAGLCYTGSFYG